MDNIHQAKESPKPVDKRILVITRCTECYFAWDNNRHVIQNKCYFSGGIKIPYVPGKGWGMTIPEGCKLASLSSLTSASDQLSEIVQKAENSERYYD